MENIKAIASKSMSSVDEGMETFVLFLDDKRVGLLQRETKIEDEVPVSDFYLQLNDGSPRLIKRSILNMTIFEDEEFSQFEIDFINREVWV